MDDPVISCLSFVVRKTCLTFGILLSFLGERLLDLVGLVFNILAFCTIIRIPGLIEGLVNGGGGPSFRWRWKYVGIWQLAVFILDIPLYATIPFYIMCPWRIYLVVKGAMNKNEFRHFYWEGCDIRQRILKHFVLLLFDILAIPFAFCLALSWRSAWVYKLYSKCKKNEVTVKCLIVCQFLHLLLDLVFLPFTLVLLLSWRAPIIVKKFVKNYFKRPKSSNVATIGTFNEHDLMMKWSIFCQSIQYVGDLLTIPPMIITLFSWRIIFFVSTCSRARKGESNKFNRMSLNKCYSWLRKKFWQNAFYFFIDLPCFMILLLLVLLLPVIPWRLVQYLRGIGGRLWDTKSQSQPDKVADGDVLTEEALRLNTQENTTAYVEVTDAGILSEAALHLNTEENTTAYVLPVYQQQGKSQKAKQWHERKLLLVVLCCAIADIVSIIASLIVFVTVWRVPFLIHESWGIHKGKHKKGSMSEGMIAGRFCMETSMALWKASLVNCGLILVDTITAVVGLFVMVTIWRAFPLACSFKSAFSPKDPDEKVTIFTVNGMKIRRNVFKHFAFLLVDIPAICLCFLHIPFVIKLPAIISVVVGGNFYLEFAITVYMETAKLLVDIVFFVLFLVMCCVRPVAIWIHVLEDEKHKRYRLSSDALVHIQWMLKQRDATLEEAESMLCTLIKESMSLTSTLADQVNYAEACLSKVVCKFTKKLEKVRDQLYEEEIDDQIIYHLSKVIFFVNKSAYMMGRKFLVEKTYIKTGSVIDHRRNLDLIKKEEDAYKRRSDLAFEALKDYKFGVVPLWENKVGFMERSRKETQTAIIAAVTSGNFVTFVLCCVNTILLYRAPAMFTSICNAPHLRRKIALKTLKSYLLDYLMMLKIFLICLSIYKIPDLISALVVSLIQKHSIKAARKAVDAIPSDILLDIMSALQLLCSWKTIAYTFSSILFLALMPLSVMVKIFTHTFKHSFIVAYLASGLLYLTVVICPFIITLVAPEKILTNEAMNPENLSTAIAGYVLLLVLILLLFVFIKAKDLDKDQLLVKDVDYVRINWFNLHVYLKIIIEFVQMMALVFTVKLTYFQYHSTFKTLSKYILLDVYDSMVKLSLASTLFVIWFLTASIPIVLEGILKYAEKGTFTNGKFTWRAFLSFFGTTLFMFIPEVSLSFLACDYSNCNGNSTADCATLIEDSEMVCWTGQHLPVAAFSLFGMMWYLLTSTLVCLTFNDVYNKKIDVHFSPTYTAVENIFKVGMITALTLFRNNIYSLVAAAVLLLILIVITCVWKVVTQNKVCNRVPLVFLKLGCLTTVFISAIAILVIEKMELSGYATFYGLGALMLAVAIGFTIASCWGELEKQSAQEKARQQFKRLICKLMGRLQKLDAFLPAWEKTRPSYKRMLRHVRVAHPLDKTFEISPPTDHVVLNTNEAPPPTYEDVAALEPLPEPPSYESILNEQQDKLQADCYFVPSASIYLSPFGDWETYDAGKILEVNGWMIASASDAVIELTDVQCTGSQMLLLIEQNIKYTIHSFAFMQSLATWRETVDKSTWIDLLKCAEELERSVDSSFERPLHGDLPNDYVFSPNPDTSTFPMYFVLRDVTSIKMTIHKRELEILLRVIPEPWNSVFAKVIPEDKPLINRVNLSHEHISSSGESLTGESLTNIELFKKVSIVIKDIDAGGFKIAKGAKIILPKSINITTINDSTICFSKPFLSGSKGPITKNIERINCKKIEDKWYLVLGDKRAKFSKILATLDQLEFHM